jgi:hypothetical protein
MGPPQGGMSNPYANSGGFGPPMGVVLLLVQAGLRIHISMAVRLLRGTPLRVHRIRMEMAARHQHGTSHRKRPILIVPMVEEHPDLAGERLLGTLRGRRLRILITSGGSTGTTNWGDATPGRNAGGAMQLLQGLLVVRVDLLAHGVRMIGLAYLFYSLTINHLSFVQGAPTPGVAATPGVHLAQTPAYIPATPASMSQTPKGVWTAATNAATPGEVPADHHRPGDEDGQCISWSVSFGVNSLFL